MFDSDRERLAANVRSASTQDLLDRVTLYRAGMEPEALEIIEEELRRRGVTAAQQVDHATARGEVVRDAAGVPLRCERCGRPAVSCVWGWHWLWGKVPLFPRRVALCAEHVTPSPGASARPPA
jgi:hypothetical protein